MSVTLALAFSHHIGLHGDHNEVHPSIRYTHDNFIAGAYLNSEDNVSPYAGLRYEYGEAYIEGGIVLGYTGADVLPYGRIGYEISDSVSFFAAPAYQEPDILGAVVGIEFKF